MTKEAIIETLKEFRELQDQRPLTEEEFERAKKGLIRSFPPSFETPSQVLRRLIDIIHFDLPDDYFTTQIENLEAVTLDDVRRVASHHIRPDRLAILVVGDRAVVEPGLRELELPLVHLDYEGRLVE